MGTCHVGVVYLDFQEAFDKVPHEDRVNECGMNDKIMTVSYLTFHKGEGQISSGVWSLFSDSQRGTKLCFQFFFPMAKTDFFGQSPIPLNIRHWIVVWIGSWLCHAEGKGLLLMGGGSSDWGRVESKVPHRFGANISMKFTTFLIILCLSCLYYMFTYSMGDDGGRL